MVYYSLIQPTQLTLRHHLVGMQGQLRFSSAGRTNNKSSQKSAKHPYLEFTSSQIIKGKFRIGQIKGKSGKSAGKRSFYFIILHFQFLPLSSRANLQETMENSTFCQQTPMGSGRKLQIPGIPTGSPKKMLSSLHRPSELILG